MADKPPTIREVAQLAGTSIATVSRHLSGTGPVGKGVAARINTVVAQIGYQPNLSARQMRRPPARQLWLLAGPCWDAFQTGFIQALVTHAHGEGMDVLLAPPGGLPHAGGASGVIWLGEGEPPSIGVHAPRVYVCTGHGAGGAAAPADNCQPAYDTVRGEPQGAVRVCVRHLAELGHRRIAFVGPEDDAAREGAEAFRQAMAAQGLATDAQLCVRSQASANALARRLAALGATAACCEAEETAVRLLSAFASMGTPVPGHLSLISMTEGARVDSAHPALTAAKLPPDGCAKAALACLLARMAEPKAPAALRTVPWVLARRASTSAPCRR